ncbi:hypothetical protein AAVH_35183 [Aphelenchoides avenae]|nr:hypothetical protein AAVH_35183 [Aphelenchus avenae]
MVPPHVVPVVIATVPFYILQACVIVFVCCKRRKDDVYRTGFFAIYVAVSIADCALMTVNVLLALAANLGLFPAFYQQCIACPSILYKSAEYLMSCQLLFHAAIALNRFTCFGSGSVHNRLWSGRGLTLVMFILLVSPLVLTAYQLPFGTHYIIANGSIAGARRDDERINEASLIFDSVSYSTMTCVEFALSIAAIVRIKRFKTNQLPAKLRIQVKLLAYSIYMVFVQMLRALFFLSVALGSDQIPWLRYVGLTFHPLLELYCFSGTVFLLLASSQTRKDFLSFYHIGTNEHCFKSRSPSNQRHLSEGRNRELTV